MDVSDGSEASRWIVAGSGRWRGSNRRLRPSGRLPPSTSRRTFWVLRERVGVSIARALDAPAEPCPQARPFPRSTRSFGNLGEVKPKPKLKGVLRADAAEVI